MFYIVLDPQILNIYSELYEWVLYSVCIYLFEYVFTTEKRG